MKRSQYIDMIYCTIKCRLENNQITNNQIPEEINKIIEKDKMPLKWKEEEIKKEVLDLFSIKNKIKILSIVKEDSVTLFNKNDLKDSNYFRSYKDYLSENKKQINTMFLDDCSSEILSRIPDPEQSEQYNCKGLVVGYVQSGKTANIQALVSKAADNGYKFIVIFSGRMNDLRYQTQKRFTEQVIETNSQCWDSLTNVDKDFHRGSYNISLDKEKPAIAIIKKNVTVMKKFIDAIKKSNIDRDKTPFLIIDDECDDASIDINYLKKNAENNLEGKEILPSRTNALMRKMINLFKKSVYIGFSATPFANTFTDVLNTDDLYPRDFIFLLPEPSKDYVGSKKLFLTEDEDGFSNPFRFIDDYDNTEKETEVFFENSLKESIHDFILSACAMLKRKKGTDWDKNMTMLIHPGYKINDQMKWEKKVKEILEDLKPKIKYINKFPEVVKSFKKKWDTSFLPYLQDKMTFDEVWFYSKDVFEKLGDNILLLNSTKKNQLKYEEKEKIYILIGGNKLSRGLTLEGLLVSFYSRNVKKPCADTLMQMQRWCGYRGDYYDLTRIYTTRKIYEDFQRLHFIEEDFRQDLKMFSDKNLDPEETQPKIKLDKRINITSRVKRGASQIRGSYKKYLETRIFPKDKIKLSENIETIKSFLNQIKKSSKKEEGWECWECEKDQMQLIVNSYHFYDDIKEELQGAIDQYSDFKWKIAFLHTKKNTDTVSLCNDVPEAKPCLRSFTPENDSFKINILRNHSTYPKFRNTLNGNHKCGMIIYVIDKESNKKTEKDIEFVPSSDFVVGLCFLLPDEENVPVSQTQDLNRKL